jgi:hypothetical protein
MDDGSFDLAINENICGALQGDLSGLSGTQAGLGAQGLQGGLFAGSMFAADDIVGRSGSDRAVMAMRELNIIQDDNIKILNYIDGFIKLNVSLIMLYQIVRTKNIMQTAYGSMAAAAETAFMAAIQNWPAIIEAGAAAAAVGGAFYVGYRIGSSEVQADISTPIGRRKAIDAVKGAG